MQCVKSIAAGQVASGPVEDGRAVSTGGDFTVWNIALPGAVGAALACGLVVSAPANAATSCSFTNVGTTMLLNGDCWTDETILVPEGVTLDGQDFTITAKDPSGSHFVGGVIENEAATAHVTNLVIVGEFTVNACDAGADRLRGILFDGASGSIMHNKVLNLNQGASGCQEGNAIEVRSEPFGEGHPDTKTVEIGHNVVDAYQKGGIISNGDVDVWVHHNTVGASATQNDLAANAVQFGFGALGDIEHNQIAGNQWLGNSDYSATAILLYEVASGASIGQNNIGGNADIGIYVFANGVTIDNNRVFESGTDGAHGDYGIINDGAGNAVTNNKVRGYRIAVEGDSTGTKMIPHPQGN